MIEGSLEVKLPTKYGQMKSRDGKSQRRESEKRREEETESLRRCRCAKGWESRETLCFANDLWLRGSKSRLPKAAGAEPAGQMRDEKMHAVAA